MDIRELKVGDFVEYTLTGQRGKVFASNSHAVGVELADDSLVFCHPKLFIRILPYDWAMHSEGRFTHD